MRPLWDDVVVLDDKLRVRRAKVEDGWLYQIGRTSANDAIHWDTPLFVVEPVTEN